MMLPKKERRGMEKPMLHHEQGLAEHNCIKRWRREGSHA
jgi:hypothetical protein